MAADVDPLAFLTLANHPTVPPLPPHLQPTTRASSLPAPSFNRGGPVFGQTSLSANQAQYSQNIFGPSSNPDDEMDWDPTPGRTLDELRPQTFFPREEPTGLEGLFESWNWRGEEGGSGGGRNAVKAKAQLVKKGGLLGWMGIR